MMSQLKRATVYFVLYSIEEAGSSVTVVKAGHRRDVYRD
jgi:mRNA-degrading endonuclease RelE of RelBE toxin-antitoxin system